ACGDRRQSGAAAGSQAGAAGPAFPLSARKSPPAHGARTSESARPARSAAPPGRAYIIGTSDRRRPSGGTLRGALPTIGSWPEPPIQRSFASGTRFRNGDPPLARITPCFENGRTAFIQNCDEGAVAWGSTKFIVMPSRPPMPPGYAYLICARFGGRYRNAGRDDYSGIRRVALFRAPSRDSRALTFRHEPRQSGGSVRVQFQIRPVS